MAISETRIRTLPKPRNGKKRLMVDSEAGRGIGRLMLDAYPSGRKVFVFRCIHQGRRQFVTIGDYAEQGNAVGTFTLAQARREAHRLSALLQAHGDLRGYLEAEQSRHEAERRQAELERAKEGTFGELLDTYVQKLRREGKRSARETENCFRLHVREAAPDLVERKAVEITPVDIHRILSRIAAAGRTRQVNKTRAMLTAAFHYAATAAYDPRRNQGAAAFGVATNPVALIKRIPEFERAGDRVLSAEELAAYWGSLDQVSNLVVRAFLKVQLLLGGQRIAQLVRVRGTDVNTEAAIIRLQDSKGRDGIARDHLLPLTERVKKVFEDIPRISGAEGWIFTTNGQSALRPETVSAAVADYALWLKKNAKVKPFQARDLRRTAETRLAELGIIKDLRAQLLSHGVSGVQAKHYDRYSYLKEKREALERWESYLDGLVDPGRKVVDLAERRRRK